MNVVYIFQNENGQTLFFLKTKHLRSGWIKFLTAKLYIVISFRDNISFDVSVVRLQYESPCSARAAEPELPSQKIQI